MKDPRNEEGCEHQEGQHDNDDTKSIKKGTAFHMGPISGHTGKDDGRISNLQDKLRNLALIIRRQDILFRAQAPTTMMMTKISICCKTCMIKPP